MKKLTQTTRTRKVLSFIINKQLQRSKIVKQDKAREKGLPPKNLSTTKYYKMKLPLKCLIPHLKARVRKRPLQRLSMKKRGSYKTKNKIQLEVQVKNLTKTM
jgi:hypothetical protein